MTKVNFIASKLAWSTPRLVRNSHCKPLNIEVINYAGMKAEIGVVLVRISIARIKIP